MASPPDTDDSRTRRLWAYARPYLTWYLAGAVFLVLTNLAAFEIPQLIGGAVQSMRDASGADFDALRSDLIDSALMIIALATAAGIARIASRITIFNAGRFVEFDLRNDLYRQLTKLGPAYYGSIATGDLTSRVANDVTFVRVLFAVPCLHVINTLLAYSIALRKMVALDLTLTLLCLAPYPLLLLGVRSLIKAMFEQTKVVQEHLSDISSKVQENLSGVAVVKTNVMEPRENRQFLKLNEEFVGKNMRLATYRGGMQAVMSLMAGTGTLVVLWVGAERVVSGSMALGDFVEFNGYVVALAFPTIAMGWVFSIWHRGLAAFDRIAEILDEPPRIREPDAPIDVAATAEGASIEMRNVSFSYEDDEAPVLRDVSFTIPAGSTVAFVGKTGSGKTTLVKLLSRFYDPDAGEILIDGVPLPQVRLRQLRSDFGVVPQGPFLFSMSIENNLRFGLDSLEHDGTLDRTTPIESLTRPGETATPDERIDEALQMAGLADDIDGFPKGLQTLVGERGITLSGGQKQRVTIARALLLDPRVLVLDDALSSVDTKTEATILDHLDTVMAHRTSIIVTHRFNALHRVDKIFLVEQGRIVEAGTHEELVRLGGKYASMFARQQLAEGLDE